MTLTAQCTGNCNFIRVNINSIQINAQCASNITPQLLLLLHFLNSEIVEIFCQIKLVHTAAALEYLHAHKREEYQLAITMLDIHLHLNISVQLWIQWFCGHQCLFTLLQKLHVLCLLVR